jgi:hypothetical protein
LPPQPETTRLKPFLFLGALGLMGMAVGAGFYLQQEEPVGTEISWGGILEHELGKGESVELVALAYGVTADDIYAWNGKRDFKPGDHIAIWTRDAATDDDPSLGIQIQSALAELELQVREHISTKKKAPKGSKQKFIPVLVADLTVSGGGPAPKAQASAAPAVHGKVAGSDAAKYLETMRSLNKKVDLSAAEKNTTKTRYSSGDYNDTVRNLFAADRSGSSAKIDKWVAGHSNGNSAPASRPESTPSSVTSSAGSSRSTASFQPTPPKLGMPAPKKCLAGPSDKDLGASSGMAMASNAGLSEPEIRATMSMFVPKALGCVSGSSAFSGTLETEITVGCDGRVKAVSIEGNDGVPQAVASCLRDTLKYAPFPAHDMPDGYTFGYRVNVSR